MRERLMPDQEWVRLRVSANPAEFLAITSALRAARIPFQYRGEHAGDLLPLPRLIMVRKDRFQEADALLSNPTEPEASEVRAIEALPREAGDEVASSSTDPVSYWFGAIFGMVELSGIVPVDGLTPGARATYLEGAASAVLGVAALVGTPSAWYLLVFGVPLRFLIRLILRSDVSPVVPLLDVGWTIVTFTYFYRRRAMLGAKCRWEVAERWWPALAGPAAYAHRKPGFLRLPLWSRVLLILAVLALNGVRAWPG